MFFNNYLDYSVSGIILKLHISTKISYRDKSNWILQRRKLVLYDVVFFIYLSSKSNMICNFLHQIPIHHAKI